MASSTARVVKGIKPHVPLIKFRKSAGLGREQVNTVSTGPPAVKPQGVPDPSTSKPVGSMPRGTGIEEFDLPARYARKPLSQFEGEYIQRGGPE